MKTPKEIFDNRYLYYRDMLNKPAIPLEARHLIFDVMEEYHQSKLKNIGDIGNVIEIDNRLVEMVNEATSQSKLFGESGMTTSEISSEAMAQAYRNVRDIINSL
jgi:hypothetical protein